MYRKSLLALVVLAALPVTAATDRTIYVSTFEDEDGENASACSLREAIKAATDNRAYGGCIAGQQDVTDQIKLKAGIYQLKKPLIVGSGMTITGGDAANFDKVDPFTNVYPARSRLETTIQPAEGLAFTLFDSTSSRSTFSLNNLILKDGKSNRGGAIRAGGTVNLSRVRITNSSATDVGGAIYLEGSSANLSASDSLFDGNTAARGAVIGMSCLDNVAWTQHSVTLERSSVYDNGSNNTQSIIDYCGTVASSITSSTIANNKSNNNIIKYAHSDAYPMHPDSSLSFISNTIVKNGGTASLFYDNVGKIGLNNNIIAYNDGLSCSYALGAAEAKKLESSLITANYNALNKPGTTLTNSGECVLPEHLYKATDNNTAAVDLKSIAFESVLAPLYLDPNDQNPDPKQRVLESVGGLFPAYVPRRNEASNITLIDKGATNCSTTDQRALTRNNSSSSSSTTADTNACDIGSIEVGTLSAADLLNATNSSLVTPIEQYESNIEFYEEIYKDEDLDAKLVNRYKNLIATEKENLAAFKASRAYRQVYASVLDSSIEQEKHTVNGNRIVADLQKFGEDFSKNYDVKVEVAGRGSEQFMQTKDDKDLTVVGAASNIFCDWEPVLRQVLVRRTDNAGILAATTPAGEYEYCKYTITSKADPKVKSKGYVQARIVNIAPIAKDDEYTLVYGSSQPITLDILANDNDDGDGGPKVKGYPTGYPAFYQNPESNSYANIKLVTKPTLGKLNFEYEQPCPDNSNTRPEETCYGGKITYTADNTFSTFNDSFTYKVLDQDRTESDEATVRITNTATTSDDTRGGGGSIGLFGLFGLACLMLIRRKMNL